MRKQMQWHITVMRPKPQTFIPVPSQTPLLISITWHTYYSHDRGHIHISVQTCLGSHSVHEEHSVCSPGTVILGMGECLTLGKFECQGSDTRVRTQKNPVGFLGKPTLKNPVKKPGPRQANFDVIFHSNKEILIFTRLKE